MGGRRSLPPIRIVLAQVTIETKSQIPAFGPLLDAVEEVLGDLTGVPFIADALHAQTDHARQVHGRDAHLAVQVKGNQPTLYHQLKTLPWAQIPIGHQTRDHGHGHGRRETRTVKAVTLATPDGISLPHAQQAVRITRTRPRHLDPRHRRRTSRPTGLDPPGVTHRELALPRPRCHIR
ncbi:hypothetical protein GCM10022225_48070 [Plantactinospora mayteni]|uniref:Transposase IS4-like domain-containing protein n=1 Tax=Plantactinospora mayteni TaxID=566021 RepID=A0ABQ4ESN8_9ACTN|nr:transposase [Plantactinospora mayteni]GIG97682.1 hypothetical protein Pma05_42550 [Plantactinospora mayteni]